MPPCLIVRDDFSEQTKRILAARVGHRCSRPDCRAPTSGPQIDSRRSLNVGIAAHITAASPDGPRYNPALSRGSRCDPDNGIWLCQTCAKLVDNDESLFTVDLLRSWKSEAENQVLNTIGKTDSPDTAMPTRDVDPVFWSGLAVLQRLPNLLILSVPVAVLVALLFQFRGAFGLLLIRGYALFLVCYHVYVLGYEYFVFPQLHAHKTKPIDMLLVAGMFAALYQFSQNASDISSCVLSLVIFLAILVTWEIYTMRKGYRAYFHPPALSADRAAHWKEYRYWVLLDSCLLIALGTAWLLLKYLMLVAEPIQILSLGASIGLAIGVINVVRYEIIKARIRKLAVPSTNVNGARAA